jgi:hypothetical protein
MFICSAAFGQKQILINLRVADNIVKTDEIRVIIKNLADTISQIAFKQVRQGTQTQMSVINGLGVYSITFKFLIKNKWRKTDYEFSVGGNEKRIEIYFDFDRNDRGKEYLKT